MTPSLNACGTCGRKAKIVTFTAEQYGCGTSIRFPAGSVLHTVVCSARCVGREIILPRLKERDAVLAWNAANAAETKETDKWTRE